MKLIGIILHNLTESYDAGNSNITEEEEQEILDLLILIKDRLESKLDIMMTTEESCKFLNITRLTLNNYKNLGLIHPIKQLGGVLLYKKRELQKLKYYGLQR